VRAFHGRQELLRVAKEDMPMLISITHKETAAIDTGKSSLATESALVLMRGPPLLINLRVYVCTVCPQVLIGLKSTKKDGPQCLTAACAASTTFCSFDATLDIVMIV